VVAGAGRVSREEADRRANQEYDRFEERRRLAAEAAGEAELMKQLEQTARQVEKLKPAKGKKRRKGRKKPPGVDA